MKRARPSIALFRARHTYKDTHGEKAPDNPRILSKVGTEAGLVAVPDRPGMIYTQLDGNPGRTVITLCNSLPIAGSYVWVQKGQARAISQYEVVGLSSSPSAGQVPLNTPIGGTTDVQAALDYLLSQLAGLQTQQGGWGLAPWGDSQWGGVGSSDGGWGS